MFALFLWPRPAGPDSPVLEIIARLPPLYQVVTRISINAQTPLHHSLTISRAAAIWPKFGMFKLFHALFHMRQACTYVLVGSPWLWPSKKISPTC